MRLEHQGGVENKNVPEAYRSRFRYALEIFLSGQIDASKAPQLPSRLRFPLKRKRYGDGYAKLLAMAVSTPITDDDSSHVELSLDFLTRGCRADCLDSPSENVQKIKTDFYRLADGWGFKKGNAREILSIQVPEEN